MFSLENKKVTIIGSQKSAISLAHLIIRLKGKVKITAHNPKDEISEALKSLIASKKILAEWGRHTREFIEKSDIVVLSPGVPFDADPLLWAREKGIVVFGEIEFAAQFCSKPIIAVTGSNGKTTVVNLISEVLTAAGYRPCLCGNVGVPFSSCVLDLEHKDYVVLEVSSFQLESMVDSLNAPEDIKGFTPDIAVLLNFSQNHLDRHKDMNEYFAAKRKIFLNQDKNNYAVLNARDPYCKELEGSIASQIIYFDSERKNGDNLIDNPNYLAVMAVAKLLGIDADICLRIFDQFKGIEHRMEMVRKIDGIDFINDSKSTTAEALRWALNSIHQPIYLICGGKDKNIKFSVLKDIVRRKVKKIFAIGEAKNKIKKTFKDVISVEECHTLESAAGKARHSASKGDCVLLSPMCASFDMFRNFEERGRDFKHIVERLR